MKRTLRCGDVREDHIGQEVVLNGWVHRRRDHGGLIFIDLRDRAGLVQIVFDPEESAAALEAAHGLRAEFVIAVRGEVRRRPEGTDNPDITTGTVEMRVRELELLNEAKTPPFSIADRTDTDELIRMKYRYIDLRSERMQRNLRIRHEAARATREFLSDEGFLEVETPLLFKPTPEGARDYLVPSRVNPGLFYSLPQSPQILKQLLMVGGCDRYFQIAKCLRDEDLRADRQPEFTQIDIEFAFVDRDEVFDVTERLLAYVFKQAIGYELPVPFPRMTHAEALRDYGTDKPDTRFAMKFVDFTDLAPEVEFKVFRDVAARGGQVKGINAEGCGDTPRAQLDKLTEFAKQHKAGGLVWMRVTADGVEAPVAKFFTDEQIAEMKRRSAARPGDLLLLVADQPAIVAESLDWMRREMADRMGLIQPMTFAPLWVVDFPLVSWNEEEKRWDAEHHPFCMPHHEDWELLDTDPRRVRALSYDVVINGSECASGSIRVHRRDIQQKVFDILGISPEEADRKFGFLLNAFEYGTPPHGGIAPGFDRIVMMMCGEDNIREVIAFPKTQRAVDLMADAPGAVDVKQLRELHIKLDLPPSQ
ncbi:aspartate--tRNA ligase [bacterium]|nr:aspartate--tRNA ligase [bacterium]